MYLDKVLIILRATANCGKTTFANYLKQIYTPAIEHYPAEHKITICCADDYFTDNLGNYKFDATKLFAAHNQCKTEFLEALENKDNLIIIANTNSSNKEIDFYLENGREYGYTAFSIVMEKRFEGGDNGHNCPEKSILKQENNIKQSLKLR